MASSHFLRLGTIRGWGKLLAAARHNKRAIQRELGAAGHIDPTRINLNYALHGEALPEQIRDQARALAVEGGAKPLRKNGVAAIEIIFSLPLHAGVDSRAYFGDCVAWAAGQFDAGNFLSADVHLDEAAPHCHILILPLLNGRMRGSDLMGDRIALKARQLDFYETVSKRYGLLKPRSERISAAQKTKLSRAVLERLRVTNDPCLKSTGWQQIRDGIVTDPRPWIETLGLLVKGDKKPVKQRTTAQIFTSKGKGAKTELNNTYRGLKKLPPNPYVSVGVASFSKALERA